MPEAPEVPIEQVQEHVHHHAHGKSDWTMAVALTTALLAVLAAISALLAGHYANEGMLDSIKAANQWSYYQSKSVKLNLLRSKGELLEALGRPANDKDRTKAAEYEKELEEIRVGAEKLTEESTHRMHKHEGFAKSVTFFQVAIGIAAVSVLTRKRAFWFVALVGGAGGTVFLLLAWLH